MISKSIFIATLIGFSTVAFAGDDVEKSDTENIVVKEESTPAPKPMKKNKPFDDEDEDIAIDFSNTAEVKTNFVDDIPLDFEITDDPNNHKQTVRRVAEETIEVEEGDKQSAEEAKDVEWSFELNGDEEE